MRTLISVNIANYLFKSKLWIYLHNKYNNNQNQKQQSKEQFRFFAFHEKIHVFSVFKDKNMFLLKRIFKVSFSNIRK